MEKDYFKTFNDEVSRKICDEVKNLSKLIEEKYDGILFTCNGNLDNIYANVYNEDDEVYVEMKVIAISSYGNNLYLYCEPYFGTNPPLSEEEMEDIKNDTDFEYENWYDMLYSTSFLATALNIFECVEEYF